VGSAIPPATSSAFVADAWWRRRGVTRAGRALLRVLRVGLVVLCGLAL